MPGYRVLASDRINYRGKEFTRRGDNMPYYSGESVSEAQRVRRAPPNRSGTVSRRTPFCASSSEDGAFLAVNGWDGIVGAEGSFDDPVLFDRDSSKGNYCVDVSDVNSATIAFSLTGHFRGLSSDPNGLFMASGWFSKRYYVFPLNRLQMNRFEVCDVNKINRRGNP
jgi:hypothetical protein